MSQTYRDHVEAILADAQTRIEEIDENTFIADRPVTELRDALVAVVSYAVLKHYGIGGVTTMATFRLDGWR